MKPTQAASPAVLALAADRLESRGQAAPTVALLRAIANRAHIESAGSWRSDADRDRAVAGRVTGYREAIALARTILNEPAPDAGPPVDAPHPRCIVTNGIDGVGSASTDPLYALVDLCAFSSRDWAADREDAWLYGIVIGWGRALKSVADRHGWDAARVDRLRKLHREYARLPVWVPPDAKNDDARSSIVTVSNPEAIGNPGMTPIVDLNGHPGLIAAVQANARIVAARENAAQEILDARTGPESCD